MDLRDDTRSSEHHREGDGNPTCLRLPDSANARLRKITFVWSSTKFFLILHHPTVLVYTRPSSNAQKTLHLSLPISLELNSSHVTFDDLITTFYYFTSTTYRHPQESLRCCREHWRYLVSLGQLPSSHRPLQSRRPTPLVEISASHSQARHRGNTDPFPSASASTFPLQYRTHPSATLNTFIAMTSQNPRVYHLPGPDMNQKPSTAQHARWNFPPPARQTRHPRMFVRATTRVTEEQQERLFLPAAAHGLGRRGKRERVRHAHRAHLPADRQTRRVREKGASASVEVQRFHPSFLPIPPPPPRPLSILEHIGTSPPVPFRKGPSQSISSLTEPLLLLSPCIIDREDVTWHAWHRLEKGKAV